MTPPAKAEDVARRLVFPRSVWTHYVDLAASLQGEGIDASAHDLAACALELGAASPDLLRAWAERSAAKARAS